MATERVRDSSVSVRVAGLERVAKVFRKAAPETAKLLQYANKIFAEEVAAQAKAKVYPTVPGHHPRTGPTRRSGKGSIGRTKASIRANATTKSASIVGGGPKALGFFGHEFGGGARPTTRQFPQHKGRTGYFLYPTIRSHMDEAVERWEAIIDEVFEEL